VIANGEIGTTTSAAVKLRLNGTTDLTFNNTAYEASVIRDFNAGDYVEFLMRPGGSSPTASTLSHMEAIMFDNSAKACRATRTSNQTGIAINSDNLASWNGEDFDNDNMHDNSTNPSRITFTTAGKYMVLGNAITNVTNNLHIWIRLNGSTIISKHACQNTDQSSLETSTIYNFSANDYVELIVRPVDGSGSGSLLTGAHFEAVQLPTGASDVSVRVTKSSSQSISGETLLTWNNENFDTHTMHDNSTNNSRITIPSSGKYVVIANAITDGNNVMYTTVKLNGSTIISVNQIGNANTASGGGTNTVYSFTAGDYIEVFAHENGSTVPVNTLCHFEAFKWE